MIRRLLTLALLAMLAGPLAAQPVSPLADGGYRFNIESALRVYVDPFIQAELKLTDEQKAKIAKIPVDLLAKKKDAIEKEKAAQEEATKKQLALRVELEKKLESLVEKNLTGDQLKRLNQLTMQSLGVNAFYQADVAKALALPMDFENKLADIRNGGFQKLRKEFPGGSFPPSMDAATRVKYSEALRKMNAETLSQFVATFTDKQKKTWKELVGEPSEFAESMQGLGGRGFLGLNSRASSHVLLLANEKVLDALKVEKPVREALMEGATAIQSAASQATNLNGPGSFNSNSVLFNIGSEAAGMADAVLTTPQIKRLEQIRFQIQGMGVFMTAGFAPVGLTVGESGGMITNPLTKLTLTPAQVVKIDAVLADASKKMQQLTAPAFGGMRSINQESEEQKQARVEYQRKMTEIQQKVIADIHATFDAGQKAVWKEMAGEQFDVLKVTTSSPFVGPMSGPPGFFAMRTGRTDTIVRQWVLQANLRMRNGEYAAALALCDEAIRLAPTNTLILQQKANLLATCPSEWVRDGKQALELMKKAIAETKEPTYSQYYVLAAALAEVGQFDEAVKTQQKAIELLPPADSGLGQSGGFGTPLNPTTRLKPEYEARLKLYQAKQPARMSDPR